MKKLLYLCAIVLLSGLSYAQTNTFAATNLTNTFQQLQTFSAGITGTGSIGSLTAGAGITGTANTWAGQQSFKIANNVYHVSQWATSGAGTSISEWTSATGSGGIVEAFNALPATGGTLYLDAGYYALTSAFTLTGKSFKLAGDGKNVVFLDGSTLTGAGSTVAMTITGTLTQATYLTSPATVGTNQIAVNSASGIQADQWIQISSQTESWNNQVGIASGTYTSGISATGTVGQTCALSGFNNGNSGATATVALTGTNTIAGGTALVITLPGSGNASTSTSATAANGTATCSGTAVVVTALNSQVNYLKGEWNHIPVGGVNGTTLTLDYPTRDSYLSGVSNTNVNYLTPITVDISGFTMIGPTYVNSSSPGIACLVVKNSLNSSLHDVAFSQCNERDVGWYSAVRSDIYNVDGVNSYPFGTAYIGRNYGIIAADVFDVTAFGLHIRTGRHCWSLGSQIINGQSVVDRDVTVMASDCWGDQTFGMDAHGVAEDYQYIGNRVHGGMSIGGRGFLIALNKFYQTYNAVQTSGTMVENYISQLKSWKGTITGNDYIVDTNAVPPTGFILNDGTPSNDMNGTLNVTYNTITVPNGVSCSTIVSIRPITGDTADLINLEGNVFTDANPYTTGLSQNCPVIVGANGGTVTKIRHVNNKYRHTYPLLGYNAGTIGEVDSYGNDVTNSPFAGFDVRNFSKFISSNDHVNVANANGMTFLPKAGAVITIDGADIAQIGQGSGATNAQKGGINENSNLSPAVTLTVRRSSIINTDSNLYDGIFDSNSNVDTVFEAGNIITGATNKPVEQAQAALIYDGYFNGGLNRTSHSASIPTTGTCAQGDLDINTAPTAGGIDSWRCVTPGSPGTWASVAIGDSVVPVTITTGASASIGGSANSGVIENQNATAATAIVYTLPTAAAGKAYCVENSYNGSASDTGTLKLQTSAAGQFIVLAGAISASGGYIISAGAAGDKACVVGIDATHWTASANLGTWTLH